MTRSETDPFSLLARGDLAESEWTNAIQHAIRRFDSENPGPLVSLLESEDDHVRRHGLHVFGYLGRNSFVVLDAALALRDDPSVYARSSIMDGVLCYPCDLNPDQACKVLPLLTDREALIREKVIAYIACARLETLESAITLLDEPQRHDHIEGFQYLLNRPENIQTLFDASILSVDVRSGYALASIERLARDGGIALPPEYGGDSYVPSGVIHLMKLWITRRSRKRPTSSHRDS